MPTIGLTGNFGMGKTTVLRLLRKLGAHTFSSDDYVHEILKKPKIIRQISKILGGNVLSGTSLNKKRVADIIFNDTRKRKHVERIIHPEVLATMRATASKILKKDRAAVVVFEVPLLFEAGYGKYFDHTVATHCTRENIAKRAHKKGFTEEEAFRRLRAQMPITKKIKLADFRINNNGEIKDTEKQVHRIYNTIIRM
jgi:dephospho-CoA kinase